MKADWTPLTAELAQWRRAGLSLPLWWRDDDAVAATPALERLALLAADTGMPLHLAVIPNLVEPSLVVALEECAALIPVVHGWRHTSHAPVGEKNAEFGHIRDGAEEELRDALSVLHSSFGKRLLPLFVPPWNRIAKDYLPALANAGYLGISTYGPRKAPLAPVGLAQINTHIDPIFWRGNRGLLPPDALISGIVSNLSDRREGGSDETEPLGLLTHHLVHTEDVWTFSGDVLRVLLDGGAVPADLGRLLQAGRSPSI